MGVAGLSAYLADEKGWFATFELIEDLRLEAAAAVAALAANGVAVHMLSGDTVDSVARVAAQAGIVHAQGAVLRMINWFSCELCSHRDTTWPW